MYYAEKYYKYSRGWCVRDQKNELVCVTMYKKGAKACAEILNNLSSQVSALKGMDTQTAQAA